MFPREHLVQMFPREHLVLEALNLPYINEGRFSALALNVSYINVGKF